MSLRIWDIVLFLLQWFSSLNSHQNCRAFCALHIVHRITFCMILVNFPYYPTCFSSIFTNFLVVQSKFVNGCWLDCKLIWLLSLLHCFTSRLRTLCWWCSLLRVNIWNMILLFENTYSDFLHWVCVIFVLSFM